MPFGYVASASPSLASASVSSYLATGADPSTAGTGLRMSIDNTISSRNKADGGNITQLQPSSFLNAAVNYDTLLLGAQFLYDPDYNNVLFGFGGSGITLTSIARAGFTGDEYAVSGDSLELGPTGLVVTDHDSTANLILLANGSLVTMRAVGLATADPNTNGSIYSMDAAGVGAELAAGSRYLLISNGP